MNVVSLPSLFFILLYLIAINQRLGNPKPQKAKLFRKDNPVALCAGMKWLLHILTQKGFHHISYKKPTAGALWRVRDLPCTWPSRICPPVPQKVLESPNRSEPQAQLGLAQKSNGEKNLVILFLVSLELTLSAEDWNQACWLLQG